MTHIPLQHWAKMQLIKQHFKPPEESVLCSTAQYSQSNCISAIRPNMAHKTCLSFSLLSSRISFCLFVILGLGPVIYLSWKTTCFKRPVLENKRLAGNLTLYLGRQSRVANDWKKCELDSVKLQSATSQLSPRVVHNHPKLIVGESIFHFKSSCNQRKQMEKDTRTHVGQTVMSLYSVMDGQKANELVYEGKSRSCLARWAIHVLFGLAKSALCVNLQDGFVFCCNLSPISGNGRQQNTI